MRSRKKREGLWPKADPCLTKPDESWLGEGRCAGKGSSSRSVSLKRKKRLAAKQPYRGEAELGKGKRESGDKAVPESRKLRDSKHPKKEGPLMQVGEEGALAQEKRRSKGKAKGMR